MADTKQRSQQVAVDQTGKTVPVKPVITFSFSTVLQGQNNVVTQLHIPIDEEPSAIDAILDKVTQAVFRQKLQYDIEALERVAEGQYQEIEARDSFLISAEKMFQETDQQNRENWNAGNKKGEFHPSKLAGNERSARHQAVTNVKAAKEQRMMAERDYKRTLRQIAFLKGKLDGTDGSAVSDARDTDWEGD